MAGLGGEILDGTADASGIGGGTGCESGVPSLTSVGSFVIVSTFRTGFEVPIASFGSALDPIPGSGVGAVVATGG